MAWKTRSRRREELPANWRDIRRQVLARDKGMCVMCGERATDIDHIQRGNNHHPSNLRSLCRHCHMQRTGRDGGKTPRKPRPKPRRAPEQHPGLKGK